MPKDRGIDASQVDRYADHLKTIHFRFENAEKRRWLKTHGDRLENEIRARMPTGDRENPSQASARYGPLESAFKQIQPGAYTFDRAFYWTFLEYGTLGKGQGSGIAPRGFVRKSMAVVRRPAIKDAQASLMRLLKGFRR